MAVETPVRLRVRTPFFDFDWNSISTFVGIIRKRVQSPYGFCLNSSPLAIFQFEVANFQTFFEPTIIYLYLVYIVLVASMLSGFQISASIQPPSVIFQPSGSQVPVNGFEQSRCLPSDSAITEENFSLVLDRIEKLEAEVFKASRFIAADAVCENVVGTPMSIVAVQPTMDKPVSSESWSVLIDEIGRRVDSCAAQPTVSECIVSMKQLKRDIVSLSKTLEPFKLGDEAFSSIKPFLEQSSSIPTVETSIRQAKKEDGWWRSGVPKHILRSTGISSSKSEIPSSQKKWGPCFYCTCTEWKPGHTCEGSRLAQQKRREKESRIS